MAKTQEELNALKTEPEKRIAPAGIELEDDTLDVVRGGRTIPETIKKMEKYLNDLEGGPTDEELDIFWHIKESLQTQGIKAAKALSKRLVKNNDRMKDLPELIPSP